jgi:anti-anti-sigma factor
MGLKARRFDVRETEICGLRGLAVTGELDGATCDRLTAALDGAYGDGTVLLDLDECPFVDSMGLQVLANAAIRLEEQGSKLVVCNASEQIRGLLRLTRVVDWEGVTVHRDLPTDGTGPPG